MNFSRYISLFLVVIVFTGSHIECSDRQNGIDEVVCKMDEEKEEDFRLEDFDRLFVGDLVVAETKLRALLPQAQSLEDKSIYIQILSQIALAEAVQKKFDSAHLTLDRAEEYLGGENHLARVRVLLERGRVFYQEGNLEAARSLFIESFELSATHCFDYHTINAAHMVPFVAKSVDEKIEWNKRAIELAETSNSVEPKQWLGSLYNNIGQAYLEAKQYSLALSAFNQALKFREEEKYRPNIRVAKWAVARTLRLTGNTKRALSILLALLEEYQFMEKTDSFDIPIEMVRSSRGLVYEELAEIDGEKRKIYAALAYDDLSQDQWFARLEPERLQRLKDLMNTDLNWVISELAGPVSKAFYSKNIHKFDEALKWVHALPYGRNSDRADYLLIFSENCGTCSTKHAALVALCRENNMDAELKLGICRLDAELDPNVVSFLKVLDVDYFPEAHCYLKYGGEDIDVTFPDQRPVLKAKVLEDYSINPNEIGLKKIKLHHEYICRWIKEHKIDVKFSFDQVWKLREEWIASLGSSQSGIN